MERITAAVQRDLFARMRLRLEELERENSELRALAGTPRRPFYESEEERVEARRRVWRESKRRAKLRAA